MSIFEKGRYKIFNQSQHPYKHTLTDLGYVNPVLPNITTLEDALNTLTAAIWPNYKATVATPANLPALGTINDYYVVTDDGDGKSAGYVWQKIDNVEQWVKRYDWDWSSDNLLASAINSVAPYYVHKWGTQDRDESANLFAGDLAGQRIYGGVNANEHLILYANAGDAVGNTGYVQFGDSVRPLTDSNFTLGTNLYRFSTTYTDDLYTGTLRATSGSITDTSGAISFDNENLSTTGSIGGTTVTGSTSGTFGTTLTVATGSITDTSGAISFGDENLSTTGTLASGTHTIGTLILAAASITDTSGSISFGDENLSTTGTLGAGISTLEKVIVNDISIDVKKIWITTVDTDLELQANGIGKIKLLSDATSLGIDATGTVNVTGQLNADNIRIDDNTISSTDVDGNIALNPNGNGIIQSYSSIKPDTDSTYDFGDLTHRYNDLFIDGNIKDGTLTFTLPDLMSLRSTVYRDLARTIPAQAGDTLFYDIANNIWLANHPDTEITHSELSGLTTTDAGHTQFAMLAGRVGGQIVQGGAAASEHLVLESTAHATKGLVKTKDTFVPFTDASYSGGWLGTDLGGSSNYFRNVYTKGVFKGFRLESYTYATLPASSATSIGRATWVTDRSAIYVDSGTTQVKVGNARHIEDLAFNGTDLIKNVDVSANIQDARNCQIQLLDNTNDFERIYCSLKATSASNVRITTNIPLDAGSYRLLVFE